MSQDDQTGKKPGPGKKKDGVATPADDDKTQIMSAGDDDNTRVMSPADDDQTQVMSTADDNRTRVTYRGYDPSSGEPRHTDEDDMTRVMSGGDEPADPGITEVMPREASVGNGSGMADISDELDAGKTVIKNRFVLDKILGAGGMGSVYRAKDLRKVEARDRNPWVAVKLLNEDFKTHPESFISLQREARKSQALAHPHIVQVFDFDREGDMVFMTMELLQGDDLSACIKNHPDGLEVEEALRLTREMGSALQHAHKNKITHADFKPANVFLSENGTAKVLDFGIARAVANVDIDAATDDKTAFDPGSLGALTPAYASLEMLQGLDPEPADDIYALGCMAYQLLCGKHPYDKVPADQAQTRGMRPERIGKISRKQWRALQKAMALKRADRYQTVEDFLDQFAPLANPGVTRLKIAVVVIALAMAGYFVYQEVSGYSQTKEQVAEKQSERIDDWIDEWVANKKAPLNTLFDEIKAYEQELEADLDDHLRSFKRTGEYQQEMADLSAKLETLYEQDDWTDLLPDTAAMDETVLSDLRNELEDLRKDAGGWIGMLLDRLGGAGTAGPVGESVLERLRSELSQLRKNELSRREAPDQSAKSSARRHREAAAGEYLDLAEELANKGEFSEAWQKHTAASFMHADSLKLKKTGERLELLENEKRTEDEDEARKIRQEKEDLYVLRLQAEFETENAAIRADLENCAKTLGPIGPGATFNYDIGALESRTTRLRNKYTVPGGQPSEARAELDKLANTALVDYVRVLGECIRLYGYADPAAAKRQINIATQSFPDPAYADILAGIQIKPWNACNASFAGKGELYDCQDRLLGKGGKGPVLVVIPAGSGLEEFAISKYEISRQDFAAWCESAGTCGDSGINEQLPATGHSVNEILNYIKWLSESTGFSYHLPSIEQWQHAAEAPGTNSKIDPNCKLDSRGILKGHEMWSVDVGNSNEWGLVHHVGNARELVVDSDEKKAVGGAHEDPMDECTVQAITDADENGDILTGFRVVRTME